MAPMATLTFRDGKIEVPEELQRAWKLHDGSALHVVSSTPARILLETDEQSELGAITSWRSLKGSLPDLSTPQWREEAESRKANAAAAKERVYADPNPSATDIKRAEREWERADDELDFGPFPQR